MSIYIKTQAITLKKKSHKENDCFYTFYTKDFGKVSAIATGAAKIKSKLAGHLEPFNVISLNIARGYRSNKIIGAQIETNLQNIYNDLNKIIVCRRLIGLIDALIRDNYCDKKVFALLKKTIQIINGNTGDDKLFLIRPVFVLKLLCFLGYQPNLKSCLVCKNKITAGNHNYISYIRGGLVCKKCKKDLTDEVMFSDDLIKLFRLAINMDYNQFSKISFSQKLAGDFTASVDKYLEFRS